MGNGKDGEAAAQFRNRGEHAGLVRVVHAVGGFVKNQQRRTAEKGAGEGDALTLALGKHQAAIANHGIEAIQEQSDEAVSGGDMQSFPKLCLGRIGAGPDQIFADA